MNASLSRVTRIPAFSAWWASHRTLLLGLWVYFNRHVDLWLLMGVTALFARLWTYHRWYDDLLILLSMLALFRIAKSDHSVYGIDVFSGLLLAVTMIMMIAPGGQYLLPPPWDTAYIGIQGTVWVTVLVFLLRQARLENAMRRQRVQGRPC